MFVLRNVDKKLVFSCSHNIFRFFKFIYYSFKCNVSYRSVYSRAVTVLLLSYWGDTFNPHVCNYINYIMCNYKKLYDSKSNPIFLEMLRQILYLRFLVAHRRCHCSLLCLYGDLSWTILC